MTAKQLLPIIPDNMVVNQLIAKKGATRKWNSYTLDNLQFIFIKIEDCLYLT